MQISKFSSDPKQSNKAQGTITFMHLDVLAKKICQTAWSPATFTDHQRSNKHFESTDLLVLDIDSGLTIEEATARLDELGLSGIVATTTHHQIEKDTKPACDRFRIVLPLTETIRDEATYRATWEQAASVFPETDQACKDPARFYFPCQGVIRVGLGSKFSVFRPQENQVVSFPKMTENAPGSTIVRGVGTPVAAPLKKGRLSSKTRSFLEHGPLSDESWHYQIYKATIDLKEQGYDIEEAQAKLVSASTYDVKRLDDHDIKLIVDVYDNRTVKYPPREVASSARPDVGAVRAGSEGDNQTSVVRASEYFSDMISYLQDKDRVAGTPTRLDGLDKLLGGGKRLGEITVTHAHAKTGKNTLWHAMMYRWLEAGIPVGYASRELSPESEVIPNLLTLKEVKNAWKEEVTESVKESYRKTLESWQLYFAKGYGVFPLRDLTRWIDDLVLLGVKYFWIDHLHYLLEDPEDHKYASRFIKELKAIAKSRDVHIDLVVQPNRLQEGQRLSLDTIKGGAAIGQALDNLLLLERVDASKHITRLTLEVTRSKLARPGEIYLKYDPLTTDFVEVEKEEKLLVTAWPSDKANGTLGEARAELGAAGKITASALKPVI